jgi:cytochrome c-type biogenesis protein CcmE
MKKIHIVLLVLVAAGIASLTLFFKDITTYATFKTAGEKYKDKFVHVVAKLDKKTPLDYDGAKNPDYLGFTAIDDDNMAQKVVFKKEKPTDFEKSDKLVLKGYMRNGYFECKDIQLKCPSKYKDEQQSGAAKTNTY